MNDHDHEHSHQNDAAREGVAAARPHEHDAAPRAPELVDTVELHVGLVRAGIARYGEPFLAYLTLDGVEQRSPRLLEEFEESFLGFWPDRVAFVEHELRDRGLDSALTEFAAHWGFASVAVQWNREELFESLQELYRVTERLGGVYVFLQ